VGQPMDELTNRVLELEDVFGAAAGRLVEQLRESPGWGERFALLDSFIAARLAEAHPASEAVVWAWRRVNQTGGRVKVGALAEELGWSGKHLISRFRQEVGLPPKTLARIVRFNGALRALDSDDSSDWAQIAL